MAASASGEQVTLRIVIDEAKNKVVFAEAGKDFVDVLLSFLTLPLGTIARLVAKESNMKKVSVGSLSSLYESVANLEVKHFLAETCKEMLLQPKNSIEAYCRNMKLNIDDTESTKYFICENWKCSRQESGGLLSTFRNKKCKCGKLMNREISFGKGNKINNEGFVPGMTSFIISDDLKVMPENFQASVVLLGIEDYNAIKEVTVHVTQKEMVDLLKCSLLSETPLTDFFLRKIHFPHNAQQRIALPFNIGEPEAHVGGEIIKLKLMLRKSNSKILFALAEEDFVDFLFSFLTFPLGGVEQLLNGNSCLRSIDNLYKSMVDLDSQTYLRSSDLKDKLVKSQLAHQFKLEKQILPIDEELASNYSCYSNVDSKEKVCGYLTTAQAYKITKQEVYAPLRYLVPQSSIGEIYSNYSGRGFSKRQSLYMVTDDLVVTPSASISAVSFLTKSGIAPKDLEERIISIGMEEGLSILKASLISSLALTNGLDRFIKPIKVENVPPGDAAGPSEAPSCEAGEAV